MITPLDRLLGQPSVALERFVELGHVAIVVLAMVNLHGASVDIGFQCVKSVGQVGKFISH